MRIFKVIRRFDIRGTEPTSDYAWVNPQSQESSFSRSRSLLSGMRISSETTNLPSDKPRLKVKRPYGDKLCGKPPGGFSGHTPRVGKSIKATFMNAHYSSASGCREKCPLAMSLQLPMVNYSQEARQTRWGDVYWWIMAIEIPSGGTSHSIIQAVWRINLIMFVNANKHIIHLEFGQTRRRIRYIFFGDL